MGQTEPVRFREIPRNVLPDALDRALGELERIGGSRILINRQVKSVRENRSPVQPGSRQGCDRPALTERQIARLPKLLDEPMAVFDSATVPGSVVAPLHITDADGRPVIASMAPDVTEVL